MYYKIRAIGNIWNICLGINILRLVANFKGCPFLIVVSCGFLQQYQLLYQEL